jgi:hypothetical protein
MKRDLETMPKQTKRAFDFLSGQKLFNQSKWYLADGTALAIQSGNCESVDLDFFTQQRSFDTKKFLRLQTV